MDLKHSVKKIRVYSVTIPIAELLEIILADLGERNPDMSILNPQAIDVLKLQFREDTGALEFSFQEKKK